MFLLTHFSLMVQAVVMMLACVISVMMLERKIGGTCFYFFCYFVAGLFFNAVLFLDLVNYTYSTRWFYVLEFPSALLSAIAYGELCYNVAGLKGTLNIRIYRSIILILSFLWTIAFILTIHTSDHYMSANFNRLTFLPMAIAAWQLFFLPYYIIKKRLSHNAMAPFLDRDKAVVGVWIVAVILLLCSVITIKIRSGNYFRELTYLLFFINNLAINLTVTMILLKYVEKRFHVSSKIALATSQLAITVFAAFICWHLMSMNDNQHASAPSEQWIHYTPNSTGYMAVASKAVLNDHADAELKPLSDGLSAVAIELPWQFRFYNTDYNRLFIHGDGQIEFVRHGDNSGPSDLSNWGCIKAKPIIAALCSPGNRFNTHIWLTLDALQVTWSSKGSDAYAMGSIVARARLARNGEIAIAFTDAYSDAPLAKPQFVGLYDGGVHEDFPRRVFGGC